MVNFKNYYNLLFIVLFFPSLILGVSETNYLIGSFILFNLIFNYKKLYALILENKKAILYFTAFYIILIFSSLFSKYPIHSFKSSGLYFALIIYSFSMTLLFQEKNLYRKIFLYSGLVTCFFLSLDGIYELFNGSNIFGFSSPVRGRIVGLFNERWLIGRYLIYILPFLIGIYFLENEYLKKIKFFFYSTIILSFITIIFSGERAAFILSFIYIFFILSFFLNKLSKVKILFLFIFFFICFLIPFIFSDTSIRLKHNFLLYATSTDLDKNQYLSLFLTAWNMFIDKPFLGVGPNNFRLSCLEDIYNVSRYSCSTHPHSNTFQLLAEIGIFGFLMVFMILIFCSFKVFKLILKRDFYYKDFGIFSILISFIVYFFPFMITGNFFLSWYGFIFYFPISLFIFYKKEIG